MTAVISVENLSKSYRLGQIGTGRLVNDLQIWWARKQGKPNPLLKIGQADHGNRSGEEIWALKDINFHVEQGEVLGIIGRNGAGKSTLLKILSRVTAPTSGMVKVKGRIASLLEVGTGFHPELTGRENVFLNGAILGMTRQEVQSKFDEIVDFSGVEKFIDTPVKRYSSGMYVRLAFAVAAHLEPEILVVDEVLAVGDAEFQKKALGKMGDVASGGRTVLFVSHNMGAVEGLCKQGILLDEGNIIMSGPTKSVIDDYLNFIETTATDIPLSARTDRTGNGIVRFIDFFIEDLNGCKLKSTRSGQDTIFVFEYQCKPGYSPSDVDIGFSIGLENGTAISVLYSSYAGRLFNKIPPKGYLRCLIPSLPLSAGRYRVGARLIVGNDDADRPNEGVGMIDVERGDFYKNGGKGFHGHNAFLLKGEWSLVNG